MHAVGILSSNHKSFCSLNKIVLICFDTFYFAAAPCHKNFDVCILLDSSGSCRARNPPDQSYDNWDLLRKFAADLVDSFQVGEHASRFGTVVFSENVRLELALDEIYDAQMIKNRLMTLPYEGQETNTPEAFKVTREQCFNPQRGDRVDVDNLAVIVTDGLPYPDHRKEPAKFEAQLLRSSGAKMIAVGITDYIDKNMLQQFSSMPQIEGQNFFTAPTFAALSEIAGSVVQGSCPTGKMLFTIYSKGNQTQEI